MQDNKTSSQSPQSEGCICREIGTHLSALLGVRSEETKGHLRNARVEMLKAIRSIIDERIEQLSQPQPKGTRVTVE